MRDPIVDEFHIPLAAGGDAVRAVLRIPERARGLVIFGDAEERISREDPISHALEFDGFATLRLPATPAVGREARADLLARRVVDAANWSAAYEQTGGFPMGCFGRESGADACLLAAARLPRRIRGVVCLGPQPESLGVELSRIESPTRIIAPSDDDALITANRRAMSAFGAPVDLRIVPGRIDRLDEEAQEQVGRLAAAWFEQFVSPSPRPETPEARGIPPGYWPAG